jgi:hypothetical protein
MSETTSCPICGEGTLTVLRFDEGSAQAQTEHQQQPDSHEDLTYSCGHTVVGAALSSADGDRLDVERRTSDVTVDPGPGGGR